MTGPDLIKTNKLYSVLVFYLFLEIVKRDLQICYLLVTQYILLLIKFNINN